ncbi:MAG: hypothetical protein QOE72_4463 [Chloroflexota bacterium]|nr:hypothetical protein [Chloroflexota bacterium]
MAPAIRLPQPDRAEYTNGPPEVPSYSVNEPPGRSLSAAGDPGRPRGGAPGPDGVEDQPWQFPRSQYQSYMLKVQTRSFGCTPWSRVVSLFTTTCW